MDSIDETLVGVLSQANCDSAAAYSVHSQYPWHTSGQVAESDVERRIRLDERGRIGRELHDSTSQLLVLLELQLMRLKQLPRKGDAPAFDEVIAELGTTLADLHLQVRAVGQAESLNCRDLTDSLPAMAEAFAGRTGTLIATDIGELPACIASEVASALYRVAQEAVANATRHAKAAHISLSVTANDRSITLRVTDDGVGFAGLPTSPVRGCGVANMRARMDQVGGKLLIANREPGTTVEATVDLNPYTAGQPLLIRTAS
jgi:two-component system NarL family sensor kinase